MCALNWRIKGEWITKVYSRSLALLSFKNRPLKFSIWFCLYRLNSRIGNPAMQVIQEETQTDDEQQGQEAVQQGKIR